MYQIKDAAFFAAALWLAHLLRNSLPRDFLGFTWEDIGLFDPFALLYLAIVPGAPFILDTQGFYQRPRPCSRAVTAWLLFKGCVLVTIVVILVDFLFRMSLSRTVIILFGFISFLLVYLTEELLHYGYRSRFAHWQFKKRFILVGSPEDNARVKTDLAARPEQALEIVAELDLNDQTIGDLVKLLHQLSPNGVILNSRHTYFGQIEKAIQACEIEGVEAWLIADFFQTQISQTSFDDFYGRPVLVFRSAPEASWQGIAKQAIDFAGAAILLLLLAPVFLVVAALIRYTSPGPILFRQERAGLNGRPFTMLKFRSMVTDAEQLKQELAALNEMGGPVFKITNDPRVTPVGRVLRKWSIDELPQFLNVLRGEMSLVGPRPLPVDEVQRFDDPAHRRRLSVKPGLTCLWQVSGRNNVCDFRDWVRLQIANDWQ